MYEIVYCKSPIIKKNKDIQNTLEKLYKWLKNWGFRLFLRQKRLPKKIVVFGS